MSLEISVLFCKAIIDDKYLWKVINHCQMVTIEVSCTYSGTQLHVKMSYPDIDTKQLQSTRKLLDISLSNIIALAFAIIVTVTNYLLMREMDDCINQLCCYH
jgi:hypothetical protein